MAARNDLELARRTFLLGQQPFPKSVLVLSELEAPPKK